MEAHQKQITVYSNHTESAPVIYLPVVVGDGSEVYKFTARHAFVACRSQRTLGSLGFVGTLCQLSQLTKCRRLQSTLLANL